MDAGTPTAYLEEDASAIFAESEISVRVSLGPRSAGAATVWTCDLSYDYVIDQRGDIELEGRG